MLKGFINSFSFSVSSVGKLSQSEIEGLLNRNLNINRFQISDGNKIEVTRNPLGFINKYDSSGDKIGVVKDSPASHLTNEGFIESVKESLSPNYTINQGIIHKRYNMFPDGLIENPDSHMFYKKAHMQEAEEIFNNRYIDYNNYTVNA